LIRRGLWCRRIDFRIIFDLRSPSCSSCELIWYKCRAIFGVENVVLVIATSGPLRCGPRKSDDSSWSGDSSFE
jgi:hypothetical protein